jgi:hypothetical protein
MVARPRTGRGDAGCAGMTPASAAQPHAFERLLRRRGRHSLRAEVARVVLVAIVATVLAGCSTLADLKPGRGYSATVKGRTYDEIWNAAIRVADEHFEVRERNRESGVIRAERGMAWDSWGEYVGIFVRPPHEGEPLYTVEVVNRKKASGQISGQGWEHKVMRDIFDVLEGRPLR